MCCNAKEINTKTKEIKDDITQFLHKEYIGIRVDNFFEIIKAYPDSSPILTDIRKSISSIQVHLFCLYLFLCYKLRKSSIVYFLEQIN